MLVTFVVYWLRRIGWLLIIVLYNFTSTQLAVLIKHFSSVWKASDPCFTLDSRFYIVHCTFHCNLRHFSATIQ